MSRERDSPDGEWVSRDRDSSEAEELGRERRRSSSSPLPIHEMKEHGEEHGEQSNGGRVAATSSEKIPNQGRTQQNDPITMQNGANQAYII